MGEWSVYFLQAMTGYAAVDLGGLAELLSCRVSRSTHFHTAIYPAVQT